MVFDGAGAAHAEVPYNQFGGASGEFVAQSGGWIVRVNAPNGPRERMRVRSLRSRARENDEHGMPRCRHSRRCRWLAYKAPELHKNWLAAADSASRARWMMDWMMWTPAAVERYAPRCVCPVG